MVEMANNIMIQLMEPVWLWTKVIILYLKITMITFLKKA